MADTRRKARRGPQRVWSTIRTAAARWLRALVPPITPRLLLRALLGVLVFLCGLVAGIWFVIRYRRQAG